MSLSSFVVVAGLQPAILVFVGQLGAIAPSWVVKGFQPVIFNK